MYAKDLAGTPVGTAVYHPIEMRAFSARVGDIAFFDENGKYQWVCNAFHAQVHPIKVTLTSLASARTSLE
jgi:hypothetical protein